MGRANWYIYGVQKKVIDPSDINVDSVNDFSARTSIGVPQVERMLPDKPAGLYKYKTVKKIRNGLGDSIYELICEKIGNI